MPLTTLSRFSSFARGVVVACVIPFRSRRPVARCRPSEADRKALISAVNDLHFLARARPAAVSILAAVVRDMAAPVRAQLRRAAISKHGT
jgi:hypothetical protein